MENKYKISIITINYNNKVGLERTIQSVLQQDYCDIEYIIIDGGSFDGSADLIDKYHISKSVSEKDGGIYDAMNKGIKMATGDFIGFMNSGDTYYNAHIISDIFSNTPYEEVDIIYGDCVKVSNNGVRTTRKANEDIRNLQYHPIYRHGASFTRLSFHKEHLFDLTKPQYGYALDFLCIYSMLRTGAKFKYIGLTIMEYLEEGVSNNALSNIKYNYLVSVSDRWRLRAFIYYIKSLLWYYAA